MSELKVVETDVELFTRLTLSPEARIEFDGDRLTALYPSDASETEYVGALFHYDESGETVELPEDSVVLEAGEGVVTALVPESAYTEGGE